MTAEEGSSTFVILVSLAAAADVRCFFGDGPGDPRRRSDPRSGSSLWVDLERERTVRVGAGGGLGILGAAMGSGSDSGIEAGDLS